MAGGAEGGETFPVQPASARLLGRPSKDASGQDYSEQTSITEMETCTCGVVDRGGAAYRGLVVEVRSMRATSWVSSLTIGRVCQISK